MSKKLFSTLVFGLLCCVPTTRASAQTCVRCPDNANDTAIGTAFGVFVHRNGVDVNVSGQTVGSCEPLILKANVSYNAFGISGGIGAGFTGGTGRIIFPGGSSVDVTPADMATTLVGPAPCGTSPVKPMNNANYTLTAADIAAGTAKFTFQFTNGTSALPNTQNQCVLKISAFPQQSVSIAPIPTCTVSPANQVCPGGTAAFTVTAAGAGPFTFSWTGPALFTSTNQTITINNAQTANAGFYVATARDRFGCPTVCSNSLTLYTNPLVTIASTNVCIGSPVCLIASPATFGSTVSSYSWTKLGSSIVLSTRDRLCFTIARFANAGTYQVIVTDSHGCSGTNTGTLTLRPNPTCNVTGPTDVCELTTNTYTSTISPAGGVVTHSWAFVGPHPNATFVGSTTGPTVRIAAGVAVTSRDCFTLVDTVTRDGCPGSCTNTFCIVPCRPAICVTKLIACLLDTNLCGTFGKDATGFKVVSATSTNLPAFCYSITVSNCGTLGLTNVAVTDDRYGDLTPDFPCVAGVFAPGASCSFTFKAELASDVTNTVIAAGRSVGKGQIVNAVDTATGHVFTASIGCNKIVTSPDDLDGSTNDNHVLLPCGSGSHLVSYSVVVTNSGEADLTNILISDPLLANICSLPGPFSLPAGAVTNIALCANIPFDCGTGGTANNCANPLLGQATGCTVLELDGHQVSITGPPGGIQGDVCIGPNGNLSITGSEYVTGNIRLSPGATFSKSGSGTIGGSVQQNVNLSAEINAALATAAGASAMPCTQMLGSLNLGNGVTNTITGVAGLNVICVNDIVLNTATIKLTGPPGATFILNISGKLVLNGSSHIITAGGVQPKDVLYNVIGTGQDVAFTGGGGGINCCASSADGTLLAPQRKINLSPGLVNGQVISGLDISIVSGSSVRCPPGCTPVSLVNLITINAEISQFQSNTNINPACVRNLNGKPITTSTQCSASVECSK